jgi:hypothetical protein
MISLSDLEGRWSVERIITDLRAGLDGQFSGHAVWTPDANGLLQEEKGVLTYGTASPMQATRRYLWRETPTTLDVLFDDARPFHSVPDAGQEALHDCPPDTYRVRYTFNGRDAFSTRWHVTGPRKDAVLVTTFTRF